MAVQIYCNKKNFDVQKAERFFKERKVPYQLIDLKKHKLGKRELELFILKAGSAEKLIDRNNKQTNTHPVALVFTEELIKNAMLEDASCLITPIIRNGNQVIIGFDEKICLSWLKG
ncbi:MAG: ArsC family transcriptional regulator [Eubacteriales bacterium]|nr:ArsC family transcriptional regulator [Eubacteriales bacterium]